MSAYLDAVADSKFYFDRILMPTTGQLLVKVPFFQV